MGRNYIDCVTNFFWDESAQKYPHFEDDPFSALAEKPLGWNKRAGTTAAGCKKHAFGLSRFIFNYLTILLIKDKLSGL